MSPEQTNRGWSWPAPILNMKQLLGALRGGFDLVRLPLSEGSAPSASPSYRLRRDGQDCPSHILGEAMATRAIRNGFVGHPIKLSDEAMLYKLTTRAPARTPTND
jgi:hypothetical protein